MFLDYVDGSASAHAIRRSCYDNNWSYWFKRFYLEAYFYVYGPDAPGYDGTTEGLDGYHLDDNNIPYLQKYEIWNLFPNSVELGEHSDNGEARKVTCTFSCDNLFLADVQTYGVDHNYINKDNMPK